MARAERRLFSKVV